MHKFNNKIDYMQVKSHDLSIKSPDLGKKSRVLCKKKVKMSK